MIKVTSIYFVYDQKGNLKEYNISYEGNSAILQQLSGNMRISADEVDLSEVKEVVINKLRSALETSE